MTNAALKRDFVLHRANPLFLMSETCQSWGRFPRVKQGVHELRWVSENPFPGTELSLLPYGQGRSYGDSCLNEGGVVLATCELNRFIAFDAARGVLSCEAGVTLADILRLIVPRGWFLPVTPGTKFVSLGGAIANDIHGKNHHRSGSFGCHVRSIVLLRTDGRRLRCSPGENTQFFAATVGGLGLTGLILSAEIQLKKIESPYIDVESIKFGSLDEFFEISQNSDKDFEYTVSWIDCLAAGKSLGRGIFMRGNHSAARSAHELDRLRMNGLLSVPIDCPELLLNRATIGIFNTLYYGKQLRKVSHKRMHFDPFFYPLDSVAKWNRVYGKRGVVQFQCVVPAASDNRAMREILSLVANSKRGSFLAVLKDFGSVPSPGMMSFPRPGITLALDFPYQGEATKRLMTELDVLVRSHGGALYPAKDAFMDTQSFSQYYPRWREFLDFKDERFSSSFWRRVTADA